MGIYRSTIVGTQNDQSIDVVMGWVTNTTTGSANALTLATNIFTNWAAQIMPDLVDDYVMDHVDVIGIDNPTIFATYSNVPTPGGNTGFPMPLFVCGNVVLKTGLRGRSYNGRWGMPGLPKAVSSTTDGNAFDATQYTTYAGNVSSFYTAMDGSFGTASGPAIVSTISGGTPRPAPIATPVTTATLSQNFGSRISRKG